MSRSGTRDLDRGEPDARRVVHGLEHVVGELAHLRRHLLDGLGDEPKLLVRQDDDFANGHDARDLSCGFAAVNARRDRLRRR